MPGFDISTLTHFLPARFRCPHCLALWQDPNAVSGTSSFLCATCHSYFQGPIFGSLDSGFTLNYQLTGDFGWGSTFTTGASGPGLPVDLGENPLEHATNLAYMARQLRVPDDEMPPMRGLLQLLLTARSFVHITSFGLDEFMVAMLETVAQYRPVAAVVSGLMPKLEPTLEPAPKEAPLLEIRIEGTREDVGDQNHGKLIVVDGLVAITGSANFTHKAWRKAADGKEMVDVVTDIDRVRDINNRYFSPIWQAVDTDTSNQRTYRGFTMLRSDHPGHPQNATSEDPSGVGVTDVST